MKKFCVIGNPISHSLSPDIFNYIFKIYNIQSNYISQSIKSNLEFENFINNYNNIYNGFNITSPYKNLAFDICDEHDTIAKYTKSVNCIKIRNSKLIGYNTDAYGFKKMLDINSINPKNILILGYGGVAKSAVLSLKNDFNCNIYIYGRNLNKIQELIYNFDKIDKIGKIFLYNNKMNKKLILINCLPLKIGSKNVKSLLSYISVDSIEKCIDLNYVNSDISEELSKNNKIISGIDMLIYQALKSFKIWFENKDFDINTYYDIKKYINEKN